jgi:hypothetical protein
MLKTIEVVFDGKAFVPTAPVDLPAGAKLTAELPEHGYPGPRAGAIPATHSRGGCGLDRVHARDPLGAARPADVRGVPPPAPG